eukprot:CAMPEP_0178393984 /NCGR_PEP_ID=MMETSP0689_2-20121128/12469_1 /TAXON_ID=160604 /ORGANISM="Amphidinium massartii, Strain CS-259" /LENGTH=335 /DNA_ID=CAMNT_0020014593 /DNA_START=14 /DNA_END=1019 /DNA_ORIENTATION=+
MEKYRKFGDGGTGVNPFVPAWSNYKSSFADYGKALLLFPFALLRLSIFLVAVIWLALAQFLTALIPIGILRFPLYRMLTQIGSGIALLALGILPVSETLADHRRLKIQPSKVNGASPFDAGHGTVVFANQQSIADILYLSLKMSPVFVFVADDGSPVQLGVIAALRQACSRTPAGKFGRGISLAEISSRALSSSRGPVVVFAEGARTNGSCVLAFKARTFEGAEAQTLDKPVGVALVALEYSKIGSYTPHHTVGGGCMHVFRLCMQPWHTLKSVWLPTDVSVALKAKSLTDQVATVRTLLVRMIPGAVEVEVTSDKYAGFIEYWDSSQRSGYTQQ